MNMIMLQDEENSDKSANIVKILFIFLVLAVTLFFGFSPLFCKLSKTSTRFLSFFNCFSGGIFMGIGLFILLPESSKIFQDWAEDAIKGHEWHEMPYAYFTAFLAYAFMLLIEKIFFNSQSLIPMLNGAQAGHAHGHDHEHGEDNHSQNSEESEDSDAEEEVIKNVVSTKGKFGSFLQISNSKINL